MSKRIEVEMQEDVHRKLVDRCDKVGCSIPEYLKASVEYVLTGTSSFDFGEDEQEHLEYVN